MSNKTTGVSEDTSKDLQSNFLKALLIVNAVCCASYLLFRMGPSVADVDIWHEMALIRKAFELGFIPYEDHFAYTETVYPSVHHEWGAGFIAYLFFSCFGGFGLVLLRYFLMAILIFLLIYGLRKNKTDCSIILFLSLLPIFLLGYGASTVRAQMYSFNFTALLLIFFEMDRRGIRKWIPIWCILFVLWINIHGGCAPAGMLEN